VHYMSHRCMRFPLKVATLRFKGQVNFVDMGNDPGTMNVFCSPEKLTAKATFLLFSKKMCAIRDCISVEGIPPANVFRLWTAVSVY